MRTLLLILTLSLSFSSFAQINEVKVNKDVSTHFLSDEKLTYSDISTNHLIGDFPMENMMRVRPKENIPNGTELGYVTIVGETFFKQYKLVYEPNAHLADKKINLDQVSKLEYNNPNIDVSSIEIQSIAHNMLQEKPNHRIKGKKENKLQLTVNNVWVSQAYYFMDLTIENSTNIQYDIDQLRYKIVDKKLKKATNSQDKELHAVYQTNSNMYFKGQMRNIIVFKKFTFPQKKAFEISLSENQISGRVAKVNIKYDDILKAKKIIGAKNNSITLR